MSLRSIIYNWLRRGHDRPLLASQSPNELEFDNSQVSVRFTVVQALNGHVIQIGKYKSNPHGPDWTFQSYVVGRDENLMDAITAAVAIGAISK